jgi:hypothetical protein
MAWLLTFAIFITIGFLMISGHFITSMIIVVLLVIAVISGLIREVGS